MRVVPLNPLFACSLFGCLLLVACVPSKPPQEERRPDPQASQQAGPKSAIVRAAESYKDRARSVEATQLDAADEQRAAIDAQTQ